MAVAVPAVFIVLGSRKPEGLFVFGVGAVVWPVLALFGLLVAPTASTIGLVLWRRARRDGQRSRFLHIALILNVAGFAWWLWLALAWIAERA